GRPRAAGIAPSRSPRIPAIRNARAPPRPSGQARCGSAPPAAASAAGCAGPDFFFWDDSTSENRRAGGDAPVEVDHAESACEADLRILDLPRAGFAGELADRLDQAEVPAG